MPTDDLVVAVEHPTISSLAPGPATAIFVSGTCFHRRRGLSGLRVLVDGEPHPATAFAMPRPAYFSGLHPALSTESLMTAQADPAAALDPELRAYRSGFWATVPLPELREPGATVELGLSAALDDGSEIVAPLSSLEVTAPEAEPVPLPAAASGSATIAICMATYEPDIELFARQIHSLRDQTDRDWVCVISDDGSGQESYDEILGVVAGDSRFVASRSPGHLGFYRNFERALSLAPAEVPLLALCDQDDVWYPDKLATLRAGIGDAVLAYSDQRLVDRDGRVLRDSLWVGRRNNHTNLASMLVANTVVGASALFRRELLDYALPFPEGPGWQFHDHWLSVVALSIGDLAFVDRPLYDYVQHGGGVVSRVGVEERQARIGRRVRLRAMLRPFTRWRSSYFRTYTQQALQARVVTLRCAERLTPAKRRALARLLAAPDSPIALAWLALRPLRAALGRTETLGTEWQLAQGLLWLRILRLRLRGRQRPGGSGFDAAIPPFDPVGLGQSRLKRWLAGD